ncbi:reverse transcriptase domain-containing protein, partial [Tanacetum coccineum]
MLGCVGPLQANYIIREVHEGACGMHAGARSVVAKIMMQGYYWPTMHGDTKEVVDKCVPDSCPGSQATKDTTHIHHVFMAVLPMGPRHYGTSSRRSR